MFGKYSTKEHVTSSVDCLGEEIASDMNHLEVRFKAETERLDQLLPLVSGLQSDTKICMLNIEKTNENLILALNEA